MPRVHFVKKARKDNPVCKAGESYYWWKFRYGGKRYSLTRPKASQLTQSEYFGRLHQLQEQIEETDTDGDWDATWSLVEEIKDQLQELADEQQEKADNLPENLRYAPTGELLDERQQACEGAVSEIESIDEWDEDEPVESDFMEECDECEGTGEVPVEPDDEDGEKDVCSQCDGKGEVEDEDEFQSAYQDWEQSRDDACTQARDTLSEAIDNCFV